MEPTAMRLGMPKSAGDRVRTLFLPPVASELLPEWLDAVAQTFPNVQHLHVPEYKLEDDDRSDREVGPMEAPIVNKENEERSGGEAIPGGFSEESLVRRLYVLYRLPGLKTLDGTEFTPRERMLSRPRDNRRLRDGPKEEQQVKAKVSARKKKVAQKVVCLIDNEESDEEDATVVSLKTRKAMAESAVEVGTCHKRMSESHWSSTQTHIATMALTALNGSILSLKNNVVRSPVQDPDRWEYASVESGTAACEWACGTLSLPWRNRRSNQRLELSHHAHIVEQVSEPSIEIPPEELDAFIGRCSSPPRISIDQNSLPVESPVSPGSYQASKSLTSPFPMHFRSKREIVVSTASTLSTEDLRETFTESTTGKSSSSDCFSTDLQVIESTSFGNRNRSISERIRIVPVAKIGAIPFARTNSSPLPRPPRRKQQQRPHQPRPRRKWRAAMALSIIDCEQEEDSDVSEP